MNDKPSRCPACQGSRLSYGKAGFHKYTLDSQPGLRWLWPYIVPARRAFVCLDCGFMGHYLDATALAKLRNEDSSDPKPKGPMDEV